MSQASVCCDQACSIRECNFDEPSSSSVPMAHADSAHMETVPCQGSICPKRFVGVCSHRPRRTTAPTTMSTMRTASMGSPEVPYLPWQRGRAGKVSDPCFEGPNKTLDCPWFPHPTRLLQHTQPTPTPPWGGPLYGAECRPEQLQIRAPQPSAVLAEHRLTARNSQPWLRQQGLPRR